MYQSSMETSIIPLINAFCLPLLTLVLWLIYLIINILMGANACCTNNQQQLDLNLSPDDNIFEARFFHLYPEAKNTFSTLSYPNNYAKISRHYFTEFPEEGVYIGKECKTRHGLGIMIYEPEGLYYIGNWIKNTRQGLGIMIYKDGSYYQGEWYLNKPHGYGEYYTPDRKWYYKGKWKEGIKQGLGEQTYPDGTVFKGFFKEGLKEGQGVILFTSECKFDDREKANSSPLKQTASSAKIRCSFKGVFVKDVATGYGIQRGQNYKYEGQWANNEMNGAGKTTYYNQSGQPTEFYIGQFKNSLKDGYGEYRWSDGRIYKGQWKEGEMLSKGVFIDKRE